MPISSTSHSTRDVVLANRRAVCNPGANESTGRGTKCTSRGDRRKSRLPGDRNAIETRCFRAKWAIPEGKAARGRREETAGDRAAGNSSRSYLRFSFLFFFVERNDRLKDRLSMSTSSLITTKGLTTRGVARGMSEIATCHERTLGLNNKQSCSQGKISSNTGYKVEDNHRLLHRQ